MSIQISVIIPTCNRPGSLLRALAALERQTLRTADFEVVVVVDGNDPGTIALSNQYTGPLDLKFLGQPSLGPGPARNRGAEAAKGRVLLFLDDDIEAEPELLAAHLSVAGAADCVGVGNLTTTFCGTPGFLGIGMRLWWERKLAEMRRAGHRFSYQDLLSGHFSIAAATFARIGGFDPAFACREDYEFGARLLKAGVPFRFVATASAVHHETESVPKSLKRAFDEGRADVALARLHSSLIPSLPMARFIASDRKISWKRRVVENLVRQIPGAIERLLPLLERSGFRGIWQHLFLALRRSSYVKGVESACPDRNELRRLFTERSGEQPNLPTIDLAPGIAEAQRKIDLCESDEVLLTYQGEPLGSSRTVFIAEKLGGRHLPLWIRETCGQEYLLKRASHGLSSPKHLVLPRKPFMRTAS